MDGKLSGRLAARQRLVGRLSIPPRDAPPPVLIPKVITENGTYRAMDDSADGYSFLTVKVKPGGYAEYLFYRLYITDFARDAKDGQTFQNVARFLVIGDGGIDMAQRYGVSFTANTVANGSSAANAFDGDPSTLWESDWENAPDTTGWVQVCMDQPRAAVGFTIFTRINFRDYPHEALIQGSNDGETWESLATINDNTAARNGWQKGCNRTFLILSDGSL